MSNVLVTGGAGFIGSNLVEALVEDNHEVVVLDDFSMGTEKNLAGVAKEIRIVKGDIRDKALLLKLTKNMDFIFNQAAASSSPMFQERLVECIDININGFVNILKASKENGVKRVIYASTSSIYGNNQPPLKEDMKITPPNFYSMTKFANEHSAVIFSKVYDLETVGLRYMSVYGPHEEAKGEFANLATQFMWSMKKGNQPVIYGDGKQTRDFTFVKDIVKANILSMKTKKRMLGEVFNAGSGKAVQLNALVDMLSKLMGKNIKPKYIKTPEFFSKTYINSQLADITKISRTLNYKPDYPLERGLIEVIKSADLSKMERRNISL